MSSLSIALVLSAINNMGPGLGSAISKVKELDKTIGNTTKNASNFNLSDKWFKDAIKSADEYKEKMKQVTSEGLVQTAVGTAMLAPVKQAASAAGDFQDVMVDIRTATYDANQTLQQHEEQLSKINALALKLGADTRYSNLEAAQSMLELIKGGVQVQDVLNGSAEAAMNLAQAGKVAPEYAAEAMVKIGNAYNVQGKGMLGLADAISRVDAASTADIGSLVEGMQYASASSSMLGQSYKDTLMALGALNNAGISGSNAGTNYADFLRRLAPESTMAVKMQAKLGLSNLSPDELQNIKKGQDMLGLAGRDVFHDESGKLKPLTQIIQTLREHTKGLRSDVVQVAFDKMFGVEGGRAAIALLKQGKGSIEEIYGSYNRQMSLNERITQQQKTFNANLEQLKGSWETLLTTSGNPLLNDLTKLAQQLTSVVGKVIQWTQAHPKETAMILKTVAALGVFNIAVGTGKALFGNLFSAIAGGTSKLLSFGRGLYKTVFFFNAFKGTAKIGEVISQSISFGFPALGKLGSVFKFVGGGIVNVIRSILMALGPVGWVILGVTAVIVGAVWAWKNNFLGFRDLINKVVNWVIGAWNWLKQNWQKVVTGILVALGPLGWAILATIKLIRENWGAISTWLIQTWDGIKTAAEIVGNAIKGIWDKVFGWISDKIQGIKNIASSVLENPAVKSVINFVGKGIGTVKNGLSALTENVWGGGEKSTPLVAKGNSSYHDNRIINYNIKSTDPRLAANEVSKTDEKYKNSRDPRLARAW